MRDPAAATALWARIAGAFALVIMGCGRFDFAVHGDGGDSNEAPSGSDALAIDVFATVCGDGVCDGLHGELCGTCAADCDQPNVCGNGQCDNGETSATCETDCGPSPWSWDDSQLIEAVNAARVGGVMCPGTGSVTTAPALTLDSSGTAQAHQLAWSLAHEHYTPVPPTLTTCEGETIDQVLSAAGFTQAFVSVNYTSIADMIAGNEADPTTCPTLMSTTVTEIAAGFAFDFTSSYVVLAH